MTVKTVYRYAQILDFLRTMKAIENGWYRAEVEAVDSHRGRLLFYPKDLTDGVSREASASLVHSLSTLERVFDGNFDQESIKRSTRLREIAERYLGFTGETKIPKNLAYALLIEYPHVFESPDFDNGFIPLDERGLESVLRERRTIFYEDKTYTRSDLEELSAFERERVLHKGKSRFQHEMSDEEETYFLKSFNHHRREMSRVAGEILQSEDKENNMGKVSEMATSYLRVTAMMDFLTQITFNLGKYMGEKRGVDWREIETAKTIRDCIMRFDPNFGTRLSTYICKGLEKAILRYGMKEDRHEAGESYDPRTHSFGEARAYEEYKRALKETSQSELVRDVIRYNLAGLDEREMKIIKERFGFAGKTRILEDIGEEIGVTMETVRKIQLNAVKKVREAFFNIYDSKSEISFEPIEAAPFVPAFRITSEEDKRKLRQEVVEYVREEIKASHYPTVQDINDQFGFRLIRHFEGGIKEIYELADVDFEEVSRLRIQKAKLERIFEQLKAKNARFGERSLGIDNVVDSSPDEDSVLEGNGYSIRREGRSFDGESVVHAVSKFTKLKGINAPTQLQKADKKLYERLQRVIRQSELERDKVYEALGLEYESTPEASPSARLSELRKIVNARRKEGKITTRADLPEHLLYFVPHYVENHNKNNGSSRALSSTDVWRKYGVTTQDTQTVNDHLEDLRTKLAPYTIRNRAILGLVLKENPQIKRIFTRVMGRLQLQKDPSPAETIYNGLGIPEGRYRGVKSSTEQIAAVFEVYKDKGTGFGTSQILQRDRGISVSHKAVLRWVEDEDLRAYIENLPKNNLN